MDEHSTSQKNWFAGLSTFTKTCIGFTLLTILVLFFNLDLERVLTYFLIPFVWLFLALIYVVLVVISLVYIPVRFKKISWKAIVPLIANVITLLVVCYLFYPLLEVREIIEFRLKKGAYENVIAWIDESLQNNELVLTEGNSEFIELPNLYRNSVYGEKIIIEMKDNELSIFFPIGDGLFEYFPGFMYRSMGSAPPKGALYPELECKIHQTPNWYLCH